MDDYRIIERYLYKSFISDLYKVKDNEGNIKCIKKIPEYHKTKEIEILKSLSHPNIVKYYSSFYIEGNNSLSSYNCLVQEFIIGHTLKELMIRNSLSHKKINAIILELCRTLEYIHKKNILHLDIRPCNIMITYDTDSSLKLIDFGISKYMIREVNNDSYFTQGFGQNNHYPIEFLNKGIYGKFTDIWGIGIILYFLITGNLPFYSRPQIKNKWSIPKKLQDSPYKEILIKILTHDFNNRPNIKEIREYIQEYQQKSE